MRITGWLHTVRPIHVASPAKAGEGNATSVTVEAIPDPTTGRIDRVPIVPSTLFRGQLRRAASDIAAAEMAANGVRVSAEVFNAMRHGSNSGRLTNEAVAPGAFRVQREHPLMGMFGGGPRQGAGGALSVGPLYPLCQETVSRGIVPEDPDVENPPMGSRLVGEATTFPVIDMARDDQPTYGPAIDNLDQSVDEMIAADVQRRLRKGAEPGEGEGPTSTMRSSNLLVHRYMVPGVRLRLSLKTQGAVPAADGLLILSLLDVLNRNEVGGMRRVGYGVDVYSLGQAARSIRIDGEPMFEFDGDMLSIAPGGRAAELVDAYRAWSRDGAAWTRDDLWRATGFEGIDMTAPAVKKTPAKKPAAKKAAGGAA